MPDLEEPVLQNDPNVDWNFPADFLNAFYATRGLCPASPEGDVSFMHFLLALCQTYAGTHVFVPATITAITPTTKAHGGPAFQLDIVGTNLVAGSILHFGSATGPITYITDNHAQAIVNPAAYANAGTIAVTIQAPGGVAASNSVNFIAT